MIAPANRISGLIDQHGAPLVPAKPRRDEIRTITKRDIHARFDAAQNTDTFAEYWAQADALDADSSHSRVVRQRLVNRSRYEVGNNGYCDGMVQTHANYLVGIGPTLRLQTGNTGFNQVVEKLWAKWCKAVGFRRKLWCMAHAKVQDGEAFGVARNNPKVRHPIKLDIALFETEQCQTPYLPFQTAGYIDGIKFDEFGNAEHYDVLPQHPGGQFQVFNQQPQQIPARFVFHWFMLRRPGQHRAVPEFRSTLNTGAGSRRWREATIGAAEVAADVAMLLTTSMGPDATPDPVVPGTTEVLRKRTMMAAPMGWGATQIKAEHPNAQYGEFNRDQIREQARPKSMPTNIAACDSSDYNYASGRLDHQTYYGTLDIEREDAGDLVLDPLFALWFERAALFYGWNTDPTDTPDHIWDWPQHPVADIESEANAKDTRLKNGTLSPSQSYADEGYDFDDQLEQMAADYGVSIDEMRTVLLKANYSAAFINAGSENQGQADTRAADREEVKARRKIADRRPRKRSRVSAQV